MYDTACGLKAWRDNMLKISFPASFSAAATITRRFAPKYSGAAMNGESELIRVHIAPN